MENLDLEADSMQCALQSINNSLARRIADKRQKRNDLTPIHRLPPELITKLFHIASHTGHIQNILPILHILAQVCRKWNILILQTPSLWTEISATFHPFDLKISLRRSRNAPLTIKFGPETLSFQSPDKVPEVCRQLHRWAWAELYLADWSRIGPFLEQPAPLIESIGIGCLGGEVTVDLFAGQAPRLRHITLAYVCVPFHSPIFSRLETLAIKNIHFGPSTSQLRHILKACPYLTTFTLFKVQGAADTSIQDLGEPIVLTQLKRVNITFRELESDYYENLLPGIRAPNCTEFTMEWKFPSARTPAAVLGSFIDPLRKILTSSNDVFFHISDTEFGFQDQYGVRQPRVRLRTTATVPAEVFAWVVNTFRDELAHKSTVLKLGPNLNGWGMGFLPVLDRLRDVAEVSIGVNSTVVGGFLEYLRDPLVGNNGVKQWRLPRLRKLTLSSSPPEGWDGLVEMIRRRYDSKEEQDEAAPVSLEVLELPVLLEDLEKILGPDVVHKIAAPSFFIDNGNAVLLMPGFGQTQPSLPGAPLSFPGQPPNIHHAPDLLAGFAQQHVNHLAGNNPAVQFHPAVLGGFPPDLPHGIP